MRWPSNQGVYYEIPPVCDLDSHTRSRLNNHPATAKLPTHVPTSPHMVLFDLLVCHCTSGCTDCTKAALTLSGRLVRHRRSPVTRDSRYSLHARIVTPCIVTVTPHSVSPSSPATVSPSHPYGYPLYCHSHPYCHLSGL
eukprot:668253-Pyramimonas_sp.AAC.1